MHKLFAMKRTSDEGFTLIELLVALTIFSFGVLAVTAMQIMAIQTNARSSRTTEAYARASEYMEQTIDRDYDDIADEAEFQDGDYKVKWDVTDNSPVQDTKTITVTVTWDYLGTRTATISRIRGAKFDEDGNRL